MLLLESGGRPLLRIGPTPGSQWQRLDWLGAQMGEVLVFLATTQGAHLWDWWHRSDWSLTDGAFGLSKTHERQGDGEPNAPMITHGIRVQRVTDGGERATYWVDNGLPSLVGGRANFWGDGTSDTQSVCHLGGENVADQASTEEAKQSDWDEPKELRVTTNEISRKKPGNLPIRVSARLACEDNSSILSKAIFK